MVDAVEQMAYAKSGGVPWHGMGFPVNDDMTPREMVKAAKADWTVSKQGLFFKKKGVEVPVKDAFALVRDTDDSCLSVVGGVYKPVQNAIAADFFHKFVAEGKLQMETAGTLWHGRYFWCLARVKAADFTLGKNDKMRSYILLSQPHVNGKALVIQFTSIRVVCWNTYVASLGSNLKGTADAFRMPHSVEFTAGVKQRAVEALGIVTKQADEFKQAATLLTKCRIKKAEAEDYFCDVLQYDAEAVLAADEKKKKKDGTIREPLMLPKFRAALEYAPGQQLPTALGTMWGAFNAVTHVVDHELGRDRQAALKTAWLGTRAVLKRRALDLALKAAA